VRRGDLDPDPVRQFAAWFDAADVSVREAMALATATRDGAPSVRMVLLKGYDQRGFVFYSGYESRKGHELAENPRAALLFHWPGRQVRIEGGVERVSPAESDAYWASRPLGARLSAAASEQSAAIASRDELERRVAQLGGEPAPARPARWGGYRLAPEAFEFWEHRDDRLHDRFRYERSAAGWSVERLQP
jgi:pyridoxamine 5'-phosphate oxidase